MVAKWRIFKRPIRASSETVHSIIGACVCRHSYLQTTQSSSYTPQGFIDLEGFDGAIREGYSRNIIKHDSALNSFAKAKEGKVSCDAKVIQSSLKAYLNSAVGKLGWHGIISKEQVHQESHSFFITVMYIYH